MDTTVTKSVAIIDTYKRTKQISSEDLLFLRTASMGGALGPVWPMGTATDAVAVLCDATKKPEYCQVLTEPKALVAQSAKTNNDPYLQCLNKLKDWDPKGLEACKNNPNADPSGSSDKTILYVGIGVVAVGLVAYLLLKGK